MVRNRASGRHNERGIGMAEASVWWKSARMDKLLQTELWTSWASMLRVYAAAHGLSNHHHAVVEIGAEEILLRVDTRWLRFTRTTQTSSEGVTQPFTLNENGTVTLGSLTDEMDMAAEQATRGLFTS